MVLTYSLKEIQSADFSEEKSPAGFVLSLSNTGLLREEGVAAGSVML